MGDVEDDGGVAEERVAFLVVPDAAVVPTATNTKGAPGFPQQHPLAFAVACGSAKMTAGDALVSSRNYH